MHIFLVNDDGIGSVGIMALMDAALARGHKVTMCAPKRQQSAASQRITLTDPIYVKEYPVDQTGVKAYAIDGTPTDCVRIGMLSLIDSPVDMVISGINDGHNAGTAIRYSGTVGAATEGALFHLHSMAVSIEHGATQAMYDSFAGRAIAMAEQYAKIEVPPVTVLSINAPAIEPETWKGPVFAPLSNASFLDTYERRVSPRCGVYYWLEDGCHMEPPEEGSDLAMMAQGYITATLVGNPTEHENRCEGLLRAGCKNSAASL